MNVTNIPIGPANVVQRLLAFTAAGGANFYHVPATMVINDNTTTSLEVDFSETILLSGASMDYLFDLIELPEQLGVMDYARAAFLVGRARQNVQLAQSDFRWWIGLHRATAARWAGSSIATFGAGRQPRADRFDMGRFLYDYVRRRHRRARTTSSRMRIVDAAAIRCLVQNTDYSVRARVKRSSATRRRHAAHQCLQPHERAARPGLAVTVSQASTGYQEFTADLVAPRRHLPSRCHAARLRGRRPGANGEAFLVDNIEMFATTAAQQSFAGARSGRRKAGKRTMASPAFMASQ